MNSDDVVLVSWIHEYAFCPRRFYLRVCEKQESMNSDMVEGLDSHKRVNKEKIEKRGELIQVFSLYINSKQYNLFGICDRVDFQIQNDGVYIDFLRHKCSIHPVEFKHGRKRNADDYAQQLCAQVFCLEEMYGTKIEKGTLFYTGTKESIEISIDNSLRKRTLETIKQIRNRFVSNEMIPAQYRKLCNQCAMLDICNSKNDMSIRYIEKLKKNYFEEGDALNDTN